MPDVSIDGDLRGPHAGAIAYNLAHTGMDRVLGYGLKYPTGFSDTHLERIGRRR